MAHGKVSEADLAIGPPFPAAKPDDVEDVSWALSTAEANWNRGDHADAIKWIRRAAEAAAEAEADDRALELAKAAADLASLIVQPVESKVEGTPQMPQSNSPTAHKPSAPPPAMGKGPSRPPSGKHASAPPHAMITTPRSVPPPKTTGSGPPAPQSAKAPAGARAVAPQASLPKVVPASRAGERRAGRKSAHNLADEAARESARVAMPGEVDGDPEVTRALPGKRASGTNEARRRARASKPAFEELTRTSRTASPSIEKTDAHGKPLATDTEPPPPPSQSEPRSSLPSTTDEIDQWPTQSLSNEELTSLTDDREVRETGALTQLEVSRGASSSRKALEPGLPTSQAMRVVVWRSVDGVHVAPAGTRVSAITIDAMLVAIDPSADLAAWLVKK